MSRSVSWRWSIVAGLLMLAALPVAASAQQTTAQQTTPTNIQVNIDSPTSDLYISEGQVVDIGGWAVDWGMSGGPRIDAVEVWVDGIRGQGLRIDATYGTSRPDVAQVFKRPDLTNAGFDVRWTARGLTPGQHTFNVYAHSVRGDWASSNVTIAGVVGPPVAYVPPAPVSQQPAYVPPPQMAQPAMVPPPPPGFGCTMDPMLAAMTPNLALCPR